MHKGPQALVMVSNEVTVPGRATRGLCSFPAKSDWTSAYVCLAPHGKLSKKVGRELRSFCWTETFPPSLPCRSMWHLDRSYPYPFWLLHQGQLLPRGLSAAQSSCLPVKRLKKRRKLKRRKLPPSLYSRACGGSGQALISNPLSAISLSPLSLRTRNT